MSDNLTPPTHLSFPEREPLVNRMIRFCMDNPLIVVLAVILLSGWGLYVMPFEWDSKGFPTDPVPVDAIPNIGENQQIVFTDWEGRSPQDVEDQVTYPLTVAMLGVPGVKDVRSYSMFGFSSVNIIFKDDVDFYWSRTRILERLSTVQSDLPAGVVPQLGPDSTALGQVFWYTLEGKEWGLEELRSIQDWTVRYALQSSDGVSEVAAVGGHVKEYQVDVDPDAMRAYRVTLEEVAQAVRRSNIDVGARTIEINKVEYIVRGIGYIKTVEDLENTVIKENDNVPIFLRQVARVSLGPALRRGVLDKEGVEVCGGVVVVRFGENPLEVIKHIKTTLDRIGDREMVDGRETWVLRGFEKTLEDGTVSKIRLVPFYDRTELIRETLDTLREALKEEVLTSILIIVIMLSHFLSSVLICSLLPLTILITFILMWLFNVDANIMSLAGIAIAIGEMVDMGIIFCENIIARVENSDDQGEEQGAYAVVYEAATDVGSAVVTAMATTIATFLPVFAMIGAEGKLFKPLAYTKTFCLSASLIVAIAIVPCLMLILVRKKKIPLWLSLLNVALLCLGGAWVARSINGWLGLLLIALGVYRFFETSLSGWKKKTVQWILNTAIVIVILLVLTDSWMPLGHAPGFMKNLGLVVAVYGTVIAGLLLFQFFYPFLLRFFLDYKWIFFPIPIFLSVLGLSIWLGFSTLFGWIPNLMDRAGLEGDRLRASTAWVELVHKFPGLGKEFMPPLDEGSFLYMPTTMPHAGIDECQDVVSKQDQLMRSIPEVETVVGKIGRVESPLDPAPISMVETVINYKPEWGIDPATGDRVRNWRDEIQKPEDIWDEIVKEAQLPGSTAAPMLQPIETRLVMLQTGMRAAMGIKIYGPSLEVIESLGLEIERYLKEIPNIEPATVIADRVVGKPYLEIHLDRNAIARYGVNIRDVQDVIEMAIGGMPITRTVEGRERYPVRIRYQREKRDSIEALKEILVPSMRSEPAADGVMGAAAAGDAPAGPVQVPLSQLATIRYVRGPQEIKSEDTFLVSYVLFDKKADVAEVDVVQVADEYLRSKVESGELVIPRGCSYKFAGTYENQVRATNTLSIILPLSLFITFMIIYFEFRAVMTTFIIFVGILVSGAGGFILIWLYGQDWFMNFSLFGQDMRELFQVHPINLSVAVWVGFLALFGIAEDDGVVIAAYLRQRFNEVRPSSIQAIREATLYAGKRRIRPCMMTTATTILGLMPVLTSTGRGSDVMVPMAIPGFGGMIIQLITLFIVPVSYCLIREWRYRLGLES